MCEFTEWWIIDAVKTDGLETRPTKSDGLETRPTKNDVSSIDRLQRDLAARREPRPPKDDPFGLVVDFI